MIEKTAANKNDLKTNLILPFLIIRSETRGRLVKLSSEINKILSGHKYPTVVSKHLGELIMITSMIGSMLKMNGMISIQIQGNNGLIDFMTADYDTDGNIRGYAAFSDRDKIIKLENETETQHSLKNLFGNGRIIVTIENKGQKPYQGIISIDKATIPECITDYYFQSVQLETALITDVSKNANKWQASGIIIQKMPPDGGKNTSKKLIDEHENEWNTAKILLASTNSKELNDKKIAPNDLLFRLFHEHGVKVFTPHKVVAKCRCSKSKMLNALKSLNKEALAQHSKNGIIEVTCHFCNKTHKFKESQICSEKK